MTMGVAAPTAVEPSTFAPSEKVTEPVIWGRADAPGGWKMFSDTVKVTEFPAEDGLNEEFKAPSVAESFKTDTVVGDAVELPPKLASPPYCAVIGCCPAEENGGVLKTAGPPAGFVLFSCAVPMEVPPSKNVTVPVGMPAPGVTGATEAPHCTGCPTMACDCVPGGIQETVRVVGAGLIMSEFADAVVAPLKFVSPEYCAVIWCVPTVREEIVKVAWPPLNVTAEPRAVVPSKKVTEPVGVPLAGATAVTVAFKVTG